MHCAVIRVIVTGFILNLVGTLCLAVSILVGQTGPRKTHSSERAFADSFRTILGGVVALIGVWVTFLVWRGWALSSHFHEFDPLTPGYWTRTPFLFLPPKLLGVTAPKTAGKTIPTEPRATSFKVLVVLDDVLEELENWGSCGKRPVCSLTSSSNMASEAPIYIDDAKV